MKVISKETKKRRILLLSTSFPLREGSISGIFVKHLALALARSNCIKVVTADHSADSVSDVGCLDIVRFRYAPRKWQTLAHLPGGIPAQLRVRKYLILLVPFFLLSYIFKVVLYSKKTDLIHANWAVSAAVASLAKAFRKIGLITTLRGEDVKKDQSFPSSFFLKMALRHSDAVVLVSDDMKALLQELYPEYEYKYRVINNGVDSLFLEGGCAANLLANSVPALKLVFVGSLIQRKNIIFIINVLIMLKSKNIAFEFTVVGDGSERLELETYVLESGLGDQVSFVGELPYVEIIHVLKTHPIYISASLHEGRPNSVIEAMASGCCCILSDINGHKELSQNNKTGLSFSLSDEVELSRVLIKLIKEPEFGIKIGELARSFIIDSGLSWESCAEKYDELFDLCVKRRGC
tara:strand:+ start:473 stop:1693 length:1221 start_codon:yes stop_codon:yes gene_type:complete